MILLELFFCFFQIGLFSIGGGYAAISLIQNQTVNLHAWITFEEFMDLATIADCNQRGYLCRSEDSWPPGSRRLHIGLHSALSGDRISTFLYLFPLSSAAHAEKHSVHPQSCDRGFDCGGGGKHDPSDSAWSRPVRLHGAGQLDRLAFVWMRLPAAEKKQIQSHCDPAALRSD